MFKTSRFLAGIWVGASLLAFPVAALLLYLLTGKLPVPGKGRKRLADPEEALAQLSRLARKALEGGYR